MTRRRAGAAFVAVAVLVVGVALVAIGASGAPSTTTAAGVPHVALRAPAPAQVNSAFEETVVLGGHRPRQPFLGTLLIAALVGVLLAGGRLVLDRYPSGVRRRLVQAWSVRGPPSNLLAHT